VKKASCVFTLALLGLLALLVTDAFHHADGSAAIEYDEAPPTTTLLIGEQKISDDSSITVSSVTPIKLIATDNIGGTSVISTAYRLYNSTYTKGWQTFTEPLKLTGLSDGQYCLAYNSTDRAGNVETTKIACFTVVSVQERPEQRPESILGLWINTSMALGAMIIVGSLTAAAFVFVVGLELIRQRRKNKERDAELSH